MALPFSSDQNDGERILNRPSISSGGRRLHGVLLGPRTQIIGPFAVAEIAEGFAFATAVLEIRKQWHQRGNHFLGRHQVFVNEIQPVAQQPAADETPCTFPPFCRPGQYRNCKVVRSRWGNPSCEA